MQSPDAQSTVKETALLAKEASVSLAITSGDQRNTALKAMANVLRNNVDTIVEANMEDMRRERDGGMKESLLDRLMLDKTRIEGIAAALESLIALPDPLGVVQQQRKLYNGIDLKRISVPLGVVAMVYEARPNVTADAAGICIKTGNACVLRGGSAAVCSNKVIARLLHDAAVEAGMPKNCIMLIQTIDRSATDELMSLHGIVDVLIPRGGVGLIQHCVEHSKVPVIETGTGNCHVYVHKSADLEMALNIVINAKCRRTGVCNACETLLVDEGIMEAFLPKTMQVLNDKGITIHADDKIFALAKDLGFSNVVLATEKDWETEYLSEDISVKSVKDEIEAIKHINTYGTKHSEAIVANDASTQKRFCSAIDAAAVYVNASTAFTDGGEFGMGAEIGISTQKLHARGPFALEALTSYKYILRGEGQVRT